MIFRTDVQPVIDHPAAIAWERLGVGRAPERVDVLTTRKGHHPSSKSRVYRLVGVGGKNSIVAKRAGRETIERERIVYQEILQPLSGDAPQCFGAWIDDAADAWLFLEEVTGPQLDEEQTAHRLLAANWLGSLHAATAVMPRLRDRLPAHSLDQYLNLLRGAADAIEVSAGNAALTQDDRTALGATRRELELLQRSWATIEQQCATMPHCLVHGDFIAKNVRIDGQRLVALDWEAAGWGVPAEDLGALDQTIADLGRRDVDAYWARVRDAWPNFDRDAAEQMRNIGIVLRYVCWIQAECIGLESEWVEQTVEHLAIYGQRLGRARELAGLT